MASLKRVARVPHAVPTGVPSSTLSMNAKSVGTDVQNITRFDFGANCTALLRVFALVVFLAAARLTGPSSINGVWKKSKDVLVL